ncbi:MAG: hypothetical protein JWM57_4015 [Phycisphaerales bacterium]|nr:hypothetical protein [Phycisphaerales bacterium]
MANWYVARSGQQQEGPFSDSVMESMAANGQLSGEDMVWQDGMASWTRAADLPQLARLFKAAPQTLSYTAGLATGANPQMTDRAMEMLRQTRPWARLVGVIVIIFAALGALGGVAILLTSILGFAQGGGGGVAAGGFMVGIGVMYLVIAVLYMMPGIYLWRYASSITQLLHLRREDVLERALEAQKSFWKFIGIVILITFGLWLLMLIVMIVLGVTGSMNQPTTFSPSPPIHRFP